MSCCILILDPKCEKLESFSQGNDVDHVADVVAAGCKPVRHNWKNAKTGYSLGSFSSIDDHDMEKTVSHHTRTMKASCPIGKTFLGGALVGLHGGVLGVIHNARGWQIQATPVEDVLEFLSCLTSICCCLIFS